MVDLIVGFLEGFRFNDVLVLRATGPAASDALGWPATSDVSEDFY